jgi:hypothetical protein
VVRLQGVAKQAAERYSPGEKNVPLLQT